MTLARRNRLPKDTVRVLMRSGRHTRRGFLTMVTQRRNEQNTANRFAVVVSKRVAKKASTRNRIRRRITEAARTTSILGGKGSDMVVIVRNAPEPFPRATELSALLRLV